LKSGDFSVRLSVVISLGEIGDPRAIGPLTQALKDEQTTVQKYAEEALNRIKTQKG
jgi:HEAT repeat protein